MKVEQIAQVCHEANKGYCAAIGDNSQKSWEEAEQWQRDSAIKGVQYFLSNPNAPKSAQHDAWMADKVADGWVYGEVKDPQARTHPCIVPFNKLPLEQQLKDALFQSVVKAFVPSIPVIDSPAH